MELKGRTAAVIGIGISNTPLIDYLLDHGAKVTARDKKEIYELPKPLTARLDKKGVRLICGAGYLDGIEEEIIFRTPGLRYDTPELAAAVERGAVLTSEMELFFELCPCRIIGITGSDGKTTTTTLISEMIKKQFGKVFLGGNIGAPLLPEVGSMTPDDVAVVELSSFQLHTMKRSPDVAVVTNLSPNHLDYHKGMEEYADAKKNIFRHMKPGGVAVLNKNNAYTREMAAEVPDGCRVIFFGDDGDVREENGTIYFGSDEIMKVSDIILPGRHNLENYMAATAAVYPGVCADNIREIARTFGGVEHRLELVRELRGVNYYNSSIDSSPTRTAAALSSFDKKVIVICGGYDKHIPFAPLADALYEHAKVVVLTGATAGKIKEAIDTANGTGLNVIMEDDFEKAVKTAAAQASFGDCVILSPACASFDVFPNFMVRGNRFKEIINELK